MRRVIRSVRRCNRPCMRRFSTQPSEPTPSDSIPEILYIVGTGCMAYHRVKNFGPDSNIVKDIAIIYGWPVVILCQSLGYVDKL